MLQRQLNETAVESRPNIIESIGETAGQRRMERITGTEKGVYCRTGIKMVQMRARCRTGKMKGKFLINKTRGNRQRPLQNRIVFFDDADGDCIVSFKETFYFNDRDKWGIDRCSFGKILKSNP